MSLSSLVFLPVPEKEQTSKWVRNYQYIYINLIVGLCVCLFNYANLCFLKSEHHESRLVGPLGTLDGSWPNGFFNLNLKV